jgi:glycosyltransferase involved in cell wall biosynthesis
VPDDVEPLRRSRFGLRDDATVFLFMFDWASYATRKNPHAVVRAFALAFPLGTERVQLLIKTQNSALRPELWANLSAEIEDERVLLKNESLTRDELAGLILSVDGFVSLHRSEGYGRVPAEAMLLGVPVILTGYSGTADFADADTACVVDYTLVPVGLTDYPGVENQRWAEADIADAARHLRWVHERPEEARMLALRGQLRIRDKLSPAKVGAAMVVMLLDEHNGLARSPQSGK